MAGSLVCCPHSRWTVGARSPRRPGEVVGFNGSYSAGTVVVKTGERSLYYVLGGGKAVRYTVGVGRAGKQWTGTSYDHRQAPAAGVVAARRGQARQARPCRT